MISLSCTKCGTTLSVDDGFAGGVCRCIACGTIQTVPSLNASPRGGANGKAGVSGQSIYERRGVGEPEPPARGGPTPGDLEALSEVVTSSGLIGGSGLTNPARGHPVGGGGSPAHRPERHPMRRPIIAGSAAAVVIALGVGVGVSVWRGAGNPPTNSRAGDATPTVATFPPSADESDAPAKPVARVKGPAFGPIALDANGPVVYLLDRGDATRAYTLPLQRAVLASVRSLGERRKFQVRYWTADGESPAFPVTPAEATPAAIAKLNAWMGDVPGGRSTDAIESLAAALVARPAEVVLITGKAWQLDEGVANEAGAKLTAGSGVRVHTVALGGSGGNDVLPRIAARTGGRSIDLDEAGLASLGP